MKKVIIVEDDNDLLETLGVLLEGEGYQVWKFERAHPVYRELKKIVPDTMVVDIRLPDIRGDKLATFVKKDKSLKGTKVILVSAGEDVAALARDSNADGYLKKPFAFEKLLQMV